MAKKKYQTEEQQNEAIEQALNAPEGEVRIEPTGDEAVETTPRAPALYLERAGVQYKFDKRAQLPKKAAFAGSVVISNELVPFQVTSNKGWTPPENVIEYIWLTLPTGEKGFITLDYLAPAVEWDQAEVVVGEGPANRTNPARIPKSEEGEQKRKAAAAATIAAKKAAAEALAANPQPEAEPAPAEQ